MPTLANLDLFAQATLAIVFEALPFLLLGSVASGLVEAFVPREKVERYLPKGRLPATLFGLALGAATPCCECGVVFLTRRLLAKGVPPGAGLAFMLAAPVVNPVSIAATLVAFRGDPTMAVWRCVVVALAAGIVGYWAGGRRGETLIKPLLGLEPTCACGHDHGHDHPHGPAHAHPGNGAAPKPLFGSLAEALPVAVLHPSLAKRTETALRHAMADFLDMAKVLVFGAMVAAAFKAFVPTPVILALEEHLWLAIPGLMVLAVILSLCSQADAFVAASFTSFPEPARLAFLAMGPMLDLKLFLMWRQVFTPRLVRVLLVVPAAVVFAACAVLGFLWPGGGA